MKKTRYKAEYVPEGGTDKFGVTNNTNDIIYLSIIGTDLNEVVKEAKSLNCFSQDECYLVCLEEFNRAINEWEAVERYDCFDL